MVCQQCPDGYLCDGPDSIAEICSDGYCSNGVSQTCPAGTLIDGDGLYEVDHCTVCPSGFTCPDGVSRQDCPDDFCKSGAGGNSNCADAGTCPGGYRCPEKSKEPIPCEAGTFSDDGTTDECTACLEGYFCPIATSRTQMLNDFECQNGYYCPTGTKSAIEYPCPKGKLGNGSRRISSGVDDNIKFKNSLLYYRL